MKITLKMLREKKACQSGIDAFVKAFPNGMKVNVKNCLVMGGHIDWAAWAFLTAPAREAYKKARATAWEAYEKARATAFVRLYKKQ